MTEENNELIDSVKSLSISSEDKSNIYKTFYIYMLTPTEYCYIFINKLITVAKNLKYSTGITQLLKAEIDVVNAFRKFYKGDSLEDAMEKLKKKFDKENSISNKSGPYELQTILDMIRFFEYALQVFDFKGNIMYQSIEKPSVFKTSNGPYFKDIILYTKVIIYKPPNGSPNNIFTRLHYIIIKSNGEIILDDFIANSEIYQDDIFVKFLLIQKGLEDNGIPKDVAKYTHEFVQVCLKCNKNILS